MISLHELLNADPDLSAYEAKEGDHETPASLSVADLKELLLAVNVLSRRVHALLSDLEAAENEVAGLKRDLTTLRMFERRGPQSPTVFRKCRTKQA